MKVTVTGAAGKLGRAVCRELLAAGHEVRATDKSLARDLPYRIELADLLDRIACYRLVEGAAAVVHLGNHPSMRGRDSQLILTENVAMNMNVFQAAAEQGVARLVFASSVQVISRTGWRNEPVASGPHFPYLPLDGQAPPQPANAYALSKQCGEAMLVYFSRVYSVAAVAVRFPFLVDKETEQWARTSRQWRYGNPAEAMAFLHVADAARLITAVLAANLTGYRCYFPAARTKATFPQLAELIREHYPDVPLRRPVGELDSLVDISEITRDTGWMPQIHDPTTAD